MTRIHHSRLAVTLLAVVLASPVCAQTFVRTDTQTYKDNLGLWVLGQPELSTNIETGLEESRTIYDAATALPTQVWAFGKVQRKMGYHPDGTMAWVADMRSSQSFNTAIQFSNWKRGIPQQIDVPGGFSKKLTVDDYGLIRSVIDENGYKTCYSFDAMGRLTRIDYPNDALDAQGKEACGTDRWNSLARSFVQVSSTTEFGLSAGHWKETVNTGNGFGVKYYDAMWRPVFAERYDSGDKTATLSQTVTRYDAAGNVSYQSYPTTGVSTYLANALGTRTTYDALGRPTRVEQDSEQGVLATTTTYLTGFRTETKTPLQKATTTSYQTFDQPSTNAPVAIVHPAGANTAIERDLFGKPLSITRSGTGSLPITRTYAYNANQELCRTTEPETGTTYMGYDLAGNLAWSSAGNAGVLSCDDAATNAVVATRKSTRKYDQRSRLIELTFADEKGEQVWTYTPDSLPATITAYNAADRKVPVINAYSYNKRRLMGGQGESLEQPGWYTWSMGYGYDRNGFLANHVYPSSITVDYAPNALGQATKAAGFASGAIYFPNGALKQFTYGNGIVHKLDQNERQLPLRSRDAYGSIAVLDDSYDYDPNGNVVAISDGLLGAPGNRSMEYDDLDRLVTATSGMWDGTLRYTYDVLDNIQTVVGPDRNLRYCYHATTRRLEFLRTGATNCSNGSANTWFDFDDQGNLKQKDEQRFVFNQDNRLREVTGVEHYRYDGHGRRVLSWSVQGLGNILGMYSNDGVMRHLYDQRKQRTQSYIYLSGSLVGTRHTGVHGENPVALYQHTDALGTPVVVTDANRNIVEQNQYEPYGKLIDKVADDNPGYTGHVEDSATGLTYMQQRYYDSSVGHFLSVDPVSALDAGAASRYWYGNDNPYKFVDPDGRLSSFCTAWSPCGASSFGSSLTPITGRRSRKLLRGLDPYQRLHRKFQTLMGQCQVGHGRRILAPAVQAYFTAPKLRRGHGVSLDSCQEGR